MRILRIMAREVGCNDIEDLKHLRYFTAYNVLHNTLKTRPIIASAREWNDAYMFFESGDFIADEGEAKERLVNLMKKYEEKAKQELCG